jgi:hypothetical protein
VIGEAIRHPSCSSDWHGRYVGQPCLGVVGVSDDVAREGEEARSALVLGGGGNLSRGMEMLRSGAGGEIRREGKQWSSRFERAGDEAVQLGRWAARWPGGGVFFSHG